MGTSIYSTILMRQGCPDETGLRARPSSATQAEQGGACRLGRHVVMRFLSRITGTGDWVQASGRVVPGVSLRLPCLQARACKPVSECMFGI